MCLQCGSGPNTSSGADCRFEQDFAIYTVNSARVNIALFNQRNIGYLVDALAAELD